MHTLFTILNVDISILAFVIIKKASLPPPQQLASVSRNCTRYFGQDSGAEQDTEEHTFLSETCEAYAFGSNSSSQLAMRFIQKLVCATQMLHLANCQVVSGWVERGGLTMACSALCV